MSRAEDKKVIRLISEDGLRVDGRRPDELRPIKLEVGVLEKADGSAYVEYGRTKIMAAVFGPREIHPRHLAISEKAVILCRYHMAPFSTEQRKSPAPSRREIEISKVIREALEPAVFTEYYPRTSIDIFIEVLQSDGGTRCAGITAASLALADAGIPMKDLVASVAVGKVDGVVVADLCDVEDKYGEADMPVALMPKFGEITLLQMDGNLSQSEFEQALQLAVESCQTIYGKQREALLNRFVQVEV